LWKLPDGDQKTLELFGNGETTGIFCFESNGMKDYLRKLKPSGIEDLIAMNALYRPILKDNINMFIDRKHGMEKIEYLHPCLEEILGVTYGIIIYNEQVFRIAQVMGKFTTEEFEQSGIPLLHAAQVIGKFKLAQADLLRKALLPEKAAMMEEMGGKFIEGAVSQGIDKNVAKEAYDLIVKFGGYVYPKAQATVYAHLAYQTAYLKAHYPLEYITAYLGAYIGNTDVFLEMKNEAERMGIRLLPPEGKRNIPMKELTTASEYLDQSRRGLYRSDSA